MLMILRRQHLQRIRSPNPGQVDTGYQQFLRQRSGAIQGPIQVKRVSRGPYLTQQATSDPGWVKASDLQDVTKPPIPAGKPGRVRLGQDNGVYM